MISFILDAGILVAGFWMKTAAGGNSLVYLASGSQYQVSYL
jgi:hypothetical protein